MKSSKRKNSATGEADLSWSFKDYQNHQKEAPDRIKSNPSKTEGQLMTDEEIKNWFSESLKVLRILKEEDGKVFAKVYQGFLRDLEYLLSLDRIDGEVLRFAHDEKNFDF